MAVAKAYLEGSDVDTNPSTGSVRLTVKLPPGTIDAEGPRTPQVCGRQPDLPVLTLRRFGVPTRCLSREVGEHIAPVHVGSQGQSNVRHT